jgi:hypothetical protein
MGHFLNEADFEGVDQIADLVAEVEAKALLEVPALGSLRPDDPVVPPELTNRWEQVGAILRRAVRRWAAQGWGGQKSQMLGPSSESYFDAAGGLEPELPYLRKIGALIDGGTGGVRPVFSAPDTYSLGPLFDRRRWPDR